MNNVHNYSEAIDNAISIDYIKWEELRGKTILLSGATGMIGCCLVDIIEKRNEKFNDNIKIVALGRNEEKAQERLKLSERSEFIEFILQDVNNSFNISQKIDYVIHAASNTHPMQYATEPVETIKTNVFGLSNMLEIAKSNNARLIFLSSVEVYGENRGDTEVFDESYCGYIDCNTLRAGYPESKRVGEALCQAYKSQYDTDVCIARLSRVYGFTMQQDDSKVIAQFIKNAVSGEDIVLKSEGLQRFGYINVVDAVTGIFTVMLSGESGQAYNIEDDKSRVVLRELAQYIADLTGVDVKFEMPKEVEKSGYSKASKALMSTNKIKKLGWTAEIDINSGVRSMIEDLKNKNG